MIFLSVGYSACHWCHVLAHESFEDEFVAEMMNKYFINIKVDREERPDVDRVYMNYLQVCIVVYRWVSTDLFGKQGHKWRRRLALVCVVSQSPMEKSVLLFTCCIKA